MGVGGVYVGEGRGEIERDRCVEVSRKSQMYESRRRNIISIYLIRDWELILCKQ